MKNFTKKTFAVFSCLILGMATLSYAGTEKTVKTSGFACPTITVTLTKQTNVLPCNGNATGMAIVTASGGTSPYTYSWSPSGGTKDTASGLTAGSYTVTATDFNGCTGTLAVTITQPTQIRDSLNAAFGNNNVSCYGGSNGNIRVGVKGGAGGYTYSWSPVSSTRNRVSNVTAGTYTCYVTDGNGCKDSLVTTVTQPSQIVDSIKSSNILCFGSKTGSITVVSTTGGTPTYSYNWSNGATTSSISNLSAGTYTLTTRDANFCNISTNVTITQPASAVSATQGSVMANCGKSDGEAYVTASGGTPGYTYSWASSGGTQDTAKNLSAGTYTCTITDANSCSTTAIVAVGNNSTLAVTPSSTPVTPCYGGSTGVAIANTSGGTGPYTYSWNGGATTSSVSNLSAGIYSVTVTDTKGCIVMTTDTVTQPGQVKDSITTTQPSCNGSNNGSVTVTVTGGTFPFTYAWSNGETTSTASNLTAGSYTVTVTDNNGCKASKSGTLTQPAAIRDSLIGLTEVSCYGGTNGFARYGVSGGSFPYTYLWSNGSTRSRVQNVTAGTYVITITDGSGCTKKDSVTITQPTQLKDSILSSVNILCNGSKTGSIKDSAWGGTPAYTYNWSPSGGTNSTASNLSAGTYTITVTDKNGCTANANTTITQPATAVTATSKVYSASCGKSNGAGMVTASGGTPGYTYNWAPSGGTLDTASGLSQGIYTCTVMDANGCNFNASVNVTDSGNISTSVVAQSNVTPCNGGSNGSATIRVIGGTGPFTYAWSPSGGTDTIASGLSAGTYTFNVTDSKTCGSTITVNITQPTVLTSSISSITNVTCNGGGNGRATVTASGGTTPYTYAWSSGQTSSNITGLSAGTYTITVTDKGGCTSVDSAIITEPLPIVDSITFINATCFGSKTGSATVVSVSGGTSPYTYNWSGGHGTNASAANLGAGTYTVTIRDVNFCNTTSNVTISQPSQLRDSITASTNVMCNGSSSGNATVGVKGGTPSYTYNWGPSGGNLATASGLSAGSYTVIVTDSNGCVNNSAIVTITQPTTAVADSSKAVSSSCGKSNGSATVYGYNGTPGYTYNWSNGQSVGNATGLSAGSYTCTVTDANGCSLNQVVIISDSSTLAASFTSVMGVSCNGTCDGMATVNATGGTGPYTYSWNNGATTTSVNNLCGGLASVSVTDNKGCTYLDTVTIAQPAPLTVVVDSNVTGGCTNTIWAVVSGGTGPYTYSWSPGGATSDTITNACAGTYSVTVTDKNSCTANGTISIVITSTPQLQAVSTFKIYPVPANNILNVTISNAGFTPQFIQVYDITGRKVLEQKVNGNSTQYSLDVSKLVDGTYILKVSGENGQKLARFTVVK